MQLSKTYQSRLICLCASLLTFAAINYVVQANVFGLQNLGRSKSLDTHTLVAPFEGGQSQQEDFLFIDIDETSLSNLGQWPWPRVILADALQRILDLDPAVLGVDLLLAEQDRFNPDALARLALGEQSIVKDNFPNGDRFLGSIVQDQPVVLATAFGQRTKNLAKKPSQAIVKDAADFDVPKIGGMIFPVDELGDAEGFGFVNVDLDHADNTVRYLPILINLDQKIYPSFVMEMIRVFEEDEKLNLSKSAGMFSNNQVSTGFANVPVTSEGNFILHHGLSDRFTTLSLSKVLDGTLTTDALRKLISDKIIVIGSSAAGLNDLHATNIEQAVPGPLIQIAAIHQILSERFIKFNDTADVMFVGLLSMMLMIVFFVSATDRINIGLLITLISTVAFLTLSHYVFISQGYILNLFLLFAFVIASLTVTLTLSALLALNKRALQNAFGAYLAPEMVKEIELSGQPPKLGGERKELSVVMTDMRNFTSLGESYGKDVEGFTSTMNRYMTAIAQPVLDNRGTLIKFIGDASLHIHGAPVDDERNSFRSVKTALEMIGAVEQFNQTLAAEDKPPVGIGVGVNTGEILVGNIGAETKFGYDVLGDPVSVAARLESQTKSYGVLLIAGSATVTKCTRDYEWWELDNIAVKGKTQPLRIYTIHKESEEHKTFLKNYYEGNWDYIFEHAAVFKAAAPKMADYYDKMIARMKLGKPNDWNGVYRATSK